MTTPLSELIPQVLARLPDEPPQTPEEAGAEREAARRKEAERRLAILIRTAGPRYEVATFATYEATTEPQKRAVADLQAYAANLREEVTAGRGILLFGTCGTGKDHLLISLARQAVTALCPVLWVNGVDLQSRMRESIRREESEDRVLDEYMKVRVLVLSDPLPPSGTLSDYQAAVLYRLVDHRYRSLLPTWCSLNVADAKEARERMGAAIIDRLRDGALAIECKWPSHRKARG